jgi:hypothetical protein
MGVRPAPTTRGTHLGTWGPGTGQRGGSREDGEGPSRQEAPSMPGNRDPAIEGRGGGGAQLGRIAPATSSRGDAKGGLKIPGGPGPSAGHSPHCQQRAALREDWVPLWRGA